MSIDHIETLGALGEHHAEQLGRILQIGIDDQHFGASRPLQSCRQRHLVAKIAAEPHSANAGIVLRLGRDDLPRPVRRAIVHQQDFVTQPGRLSGGMHAA